MTWAWPAFVLGAYLVGSIPVGVLIARGRGVDIRAAGSRNIGATNVGRVLGRRFGILCFVLDMLKGAAPVVAAGIACGPFGHPAAESAQADLWWWVAVALAAVLGHTFSIFLRFAGGKGVATACGAMAAMWPLLTWPTLVALLVWIILVRLVRIVSLASMAAALALPAAYAILAMLRAEGDGGRFIHASAPLAATTALALLVIYRHRSNIARLRDGTEPRIGDTPPPVPPPSEGGG